MSASDLDAEHPFQLFLLFWQPAAIDLVVSFGWPAASRLLLSSSANEPDRRLTSELVGVDAGRLSVEIHIQGR
jgi:hypothetical protein